MYRELGDEMLAEYEAEVAVTPSATSLQVKKFVEAFQEINPDSYLVMSEDDLFSLATVYGELHDRFRAAVQIRRLTNKEAARKQADLLLTALGG